MNILYYTSGWDGCNYYRISEVSKYLNKITGIYAKVSSQYSIEEIKWADIVVIQKQTNQKALPFIKQAKQMRKKIISEVDDCYFCIPSWNPAYKYYHDKAQDLINFYNLSDAMTVTTEHLRKEMLPYNKNVYVLPNSLNLSHQNRILKLKDEDRFKYTKYLTPDQKPILLDEAHKMLSEKIKLCWMGSPTHLRDIEQATSALKTICEENKNVVIIMMACTTENIIKSIPEGQLFLIAPVAIFNYHQALTTVNADIGICPIEDIRFNHSKSNLKFLEQSINGWAVVCSNVENYKKTITHGENGLLADNNHKSWYNNLKYLIEKPEERKRIGENAKKFVTETYDISKNIQMWVDCYKEVLEK